ncbi:MAG TPA: flagellar basal body M-ring protein FliF, partial [Rhodocyclaceae bacterium]|nr:flagellar basal body M-ring protein FliF [Rhodocyclaceae bacterium]
MAETTFPLTPDAFNRLSTPQKVGTVLAVAALAAVLVAAFLWAREPSYGVLFSNLEEKDGGQVVAALQQQNIPYRISDSGNAILVPASQVHDVRLRLASQGLPKGGLVGFEIMDTQKLGISQFAEQ